MLVYSE
jgi:argininosuccinate synthase